MLYLEAKYLGIVSSRLRNFKRKGGNLYNWSCHVCGDSRTNKKKARAFAYERGGRLFYTCHNCGASTTVPNMIRQLDPDLYSEYVLEKYQDERRDRSESLEEFARFEAQAKATLRPGDPMVGLIPAPEVDLARDLIERRRLPTDDLWHAPMFWPWATTVAAEPDRFQTSNEEARLVIPFRTKKGLSGFQGRSYVDEGIRYVSVVRDPDDLFLYGWDRVDEDETVYALEGPLDAMFVDNGVATGGGSIPTELSKTGLPAEQFVVVYDNEPRSETTVRKMRKAVAAGHRIVVWPTTLRQKDVNDMVLAGFHVDDVMSTLERRTFQGLSADLAIAEWRRVAA